MLYFSYSHHVFLIPHHGRFKSESKTLTDRDVVVGMVEKLSVAGTIIGYAPTVGNHPVDVNPFVIPKDA